jgi:hypothetical protein
MKVSDLIQAAEGEGGKSSLEQRAEKEWGKIAKEKVEVNDIGGTLYAFGSELAVLRLYHKFRGHGKADYSTNRKTWYYTNS